MAEELIEIRASRACMFCNEVASVKVTKKEYDDYVNNPGVHIQTIVPSLSADEREILISGTHPECWTKNFG